MITHRYLGANGLAQALGVTQHAVYKWRSRHPAGSRTPFPLPDVEIDDSPGWHPDRLSEIVRWRESLPGRGTGGGRPPASRRAYFAAAEARGLTLDEASRAVETLVEEFPEMTEREIHAWLVDAWRSEPSADDAGQPTNVFRLGPHS
jgi:hypothetical protein